MEISPELLQAVFGLLTALLSWGAYELAQYIRKRSGSEQMSNVVWQIHEIAKSAIGEAEAVTVNAAKAGGIWDDVKKKEVKDQVVNKVKASLNANATKFIIKNFGDLDEYLRGKIEADIAASKKTNGG